MTYAKVIDQFLAKHRIPQQQRLTFEKMMKGLNHEKLNREVDPDEAAQITERLEVLTLIVEQQRQDSSHNIAAEIAAGKEAMAANEKKTNGKDGGWSPDKVSDQLKRAEVEILRTGAKGFVVDANFVVTTAHAVDGGEPRAPYKKALIEQVRVGGKNVDLLVAICERVNDIAVLMYLSPEPPKPIDELQKSTALLRLCMDPLDAPGKAAYFRENDTWVRVVATDISDSMVRLVPEVHIERGERTTPIVNAAGELLALTANFMSDSSGHEIFGLAPRLCMALPFWVLNVMRSALTGR